MSSIATNFNEGSLLRRTLFTVAAMVGAVALLLGALSLLVVLVVGQVGGRAAETSSAVEPAGAKPSANAIGPTGGAATLKRTKSTPQSGHEI